MVCIDAKLYCSAVMVLLFSVLANANILNSRKRDFKMPYLYWMDSHWRLIKMVAEEGARQMRVC